MFYILELIKTITKYAWIWMLPVIVFGFIKIYKYKDSDEEEPNLVLKMIGFYILGGFNFSLNGFLSFSIVLPLGFGIYYFIMKDKDRLNKIVKHKCAVFGVIMLYVGLINGFICESLEYRDYRIKSYSATVSNIDEEWDIIKDKLKLDDYNMLEEFRFSYDKDKKIDNIYYKFINHNQNKIFIINNDYDDRYNVQVQKYQDEDSWNNWGWYGEDYKTIDVDEFMKLITNIEFAKSKMEENKNIENYDVIYHAYDSSTPSTNEHEDSVTYLIESEDGSIYRKAKRRELPLVGIKITVMPMERIADDMTSSVSYDSYVIYPNYRNSLIKDSTETLTIENVRDQKVLNLNNDNYEKQDILYDLDFDSWEEIEEIVIEESPYVILEDDSETRVTIYEKGNFAVYESNDETAYFRVSGYAMENLQKIKYQ